MIILRPILKQVWKNIAVMDQKRISLLTPDTGITKIQDIVYLEDGHPLHQMDVDYPDEADIPFNVDKKYPVIIDIHGGGWIYGDKELNDYYCLSLVKMNFTVVNISYRLVPEVTVKEQVQDIFAALTRFYVIASKDIGRIKYHADMDKIFVTGDSAGGMLTGLITLINGSDKLQKIYGVKALPFTIRAIGLTCPVPFILAGTVENKSAIRREMGKMIFGGAYKKSSLKGAVSMEDIIDEAPLPPVFTITATDDQECYYQAVMLDKLLTEKNVIHEYCCKEPDRAPLGHVFNIIYPHNPEAEEVNRRMTEFFLETIS